MNSDNLDLLIPDEPERDDPRIVWGTVQDSGQVLLDSDRWAGNPLPMSIPSLAAITPGDRVAVHLQGRSALILGAMYLGTEGFWDELSLVNNWENVGGTRPPARVVVEGRWGYLSGAVRNGTAGHIATVPEMAQPQYDILIPATSEGETEPFRVTVRSDGAVISNRLESDTFLSLDGLQYPLD